MKPRMLFFLIPFLLTAFLPCNAQQLVYKPVNPSFGGYYFNAQWLLASAQAQNKLSQSTPVQANNSAKTSSLQEIKDSFNKQVLNKLTSKFYESIFGEGSLKEGHYEMGDYLIDIANKGDGIHVFISDPTGGDQTEIIVPYF